MLKSLTAKDKSLPMNQTKGFSLYYYLNISFHTTCARYDVKTISFSEPSFLFGGFRIHLKNPTPKQTNKTNLTLIFKV